MPPAAVVDKFFFHELHGFKRGEPVPTQRKPVSFTGTRVRTHNPDVAGSFGHYLCSRGQTTGLAFAAGLAMAACTGTHVPASGEIGWVKQVMVHGVPIYATDTTPDEKLLHAAGVLAQFLDNDEDGVPDNPVVHQAILDTRGAIVMTGTEQEADDMDWRDAPRGQGLYAEETRLNARERGVFDYALEEIWHMVTDYGYRVAYPDVFGTEPGTTLTDAMDKARGGRFDRPPAKYPESAWYTYDDVSCDYGCMASEYVYWVYTSFIGAQDLPGRLDEIGHEWRLNTPEKLKEGEPVLHGILSDPEYKIPLAIPDGTYEGAPLVVEPYEPADP